MFCQCGCGQETRIATKNDAWAGQVKGVPLRFVYGHSRKAGKEKIENIKTGTGVCECGCGKKTSLVKKTRATRGYVEGKYCRFLNGHNRRYKSPLSMFEIDNKSGCWNWRGHLSKGYGYFGPRVAHRVVYEKVIGKIPDGLQIDHLCLNKRCVNPKHLEPVTPKENTNRYFSSISKR